MKSLLHVVVLAALLTTVEAASHFCDSRAYTSTYLHTLLLKVGLNIILAVSLNLILGIAGQFSLGHAGFYGAGAYAAMLVAGHYFAPQLRFLGRVFSLSTAVGFAVVFLASLAAAVLAATVLGWIVGLPTLRLRGDYLAIATLGFGEIFAILMQNSHAMGGATGQSLFILQEHWAGGHTADALSGAVAHYAMHYTFSVFWVFAGALLTIFLVRNIKYSTTGRALLAIREDLVASESVGVRTTRLKVLAFVVGAACAGAAGGMLAQFSMINPQSFRFMRSVELVAMVILGGQGSITGSALAATALTLFPEFLRSNQTLQHFARAGGVDIEKFRMVIYALAIILCMLFRPQGIFGQYEITDLGRFFKRKAKAGPPGGAPGADAASPAATAIADPPAPVPENHRPILETAQLGMSFGGLRAVDAFSVTINQGELFGLIGPNGAGKTTLFNMLTGIYRPTEGRILLDGKLVNGYRPNQLSHAGVARTFQNIRLFSRLSVLDNVLIAQHAQHRQGLAAAVLRTPAFFREEAATRAAAMELLAMMHLDGFSDAIAGSLSYGDQRRLEIVRALATRPRLLLLDEPAAGMNPTEKRTLMDLIWRIHRQFQLTILLIEHDMTVVMGICQRIAVLDYGKTIAMGKPAEIREDPAVIEAYLGTSRKTK